MNVKELKAKLEEQAFALKKAQSVGMMVNQETDRMRNLLVNNTDEIMEALAFAVEAEEKIERLTVEVASADEELDEKDDEIKQLREELETLKAGKLKGKRQDVK